MLHRLAVLAAAEAVVVSGMGLMGKSGKKGRDADRDEAIRKAREKVANGTGEVKAYKESTWKKAFRFFGGGALRIMKIGSWRVAFDENGDVIDAVRRDELPGAS